MKKIILAVVLVVNGCSSLDSDLSRLVRANDEKIVAAINNHDSRVVALEKKAGIFTPTPTPGANDKKS